MGWLSPLMTKGQRSQGSLKAELEFLDITLMPLDVLMVINFLLPFGAAGTRELWVGGEESRAFLMENLMMCHFLIWAVGKHTMYLLYL